MLGGEQAPFERAKPVIDNYARMATLIGRAGAGQLTKMVNQIIVAITVQGVSEGLAFAQRAGLDIPKVMETISKGAAQSWQMDNRWKTMNENKFDFGFAVDWMRKDLGIIRDEAKRNGAIIEIAKIIDGYYAEVQKMGGKRWDTSALIARLNKP
jgi:3-hydroxyisobutyrate dehydrogenase-like beta-hydroxyacid dehydrogenase